MMGCAIRETGRRVCVFGIYLFTVLACGVAVAADAPATAPAAATSRPVSVEGYLRTVRRFADAMIEHGRDTYREPTPLFASVLDRSTMKVKEELPAPKGIRSDDRDLTGSNPMHDENFFRLLYALSDITGDAKYATAADDALRYFFTHCQSQTTGLMPWGEHISWDLRTEGLLFKRDKHEFFRPWALWARTYELAPEPSLKLARGLWDHQIADQATGSFSRHATYSHHAPEDGRHEFPRHAGFYISLWGQAYEKSKDEVYLKAIETLVDNFERRRKPDGSFPSASVSPQETWWASDLSWAVDVWDASNRVPEPLATKMKNAVKKTDAAILNHFADGFGHDVAEMYPGQYGATTIAAHGLMCDARNQQLPQEGYRKLVLSAADAYLTTEPPSPEVRLRSDLTPGVFGDAIAILMTAHRLTRDPRYLTRADALADMAVNLFWTDDNPLPRASSRLDHYEAITRADTLAVSLLELWSIHTRPDRPLTLDWIDR